MKARNQHAFFFKLEHCRVEQNRISSVLNGDATEVFTRPEIEQAHVQFYSTLFLEEQIDFYCKQHCLRSYKKVLTQEQRDLCEGPLTLADLTSSLKSLNLGKSPGSDGLTIKFYLHSWDLLGPLLLHVARVCSMMVQCLT